MTSRITDKEITCNLDSELVVKQLNGEYRVKNPKMLELFLVVQSLIKRFGKVNFKHVGREDKFQQIVDEMLDLELDQRD
jgi:ribonuclease HI